MECHLDLPLLSKKVTGKKGNRGKEKHETEEIKETE